MQRDTEKPVLESLGQDCLVGTNPYCRATAGVGPHISDRILLGFPTRFPALRASLGWRKTEPLVKAGLAEIGPEGASTLEALGVRMDSVRRWEYRSCHFVLLPFFVLAVAFFGAGCLGGSTGMDSDNVANAMSSSTIGCGRSSTAKSVVISGRPTE